MKDHSNPHKLNPRCLWVSLRASPSWNFVKLLFFRHAFKQNFTRILLFNLKNFEICFENCSVVEILHWPWQQICSKAAKPFGI